VSWEDKDVAKAGHAPDCRKVQVSEHFDCSCAPPVPTLPAIGDPNDATAPAAPAAPPPTAHRGGYGTVDAKLARAIAAARKGYSLPGGEGKMIVDHYEADLERLRALIGDLESDERAERHEAALRTIAAGIGPELGEAFRGAALARAEIWPDAVGAFTQARVVAAHALDDALHAHLRQWRASAG
jgi:hypothetical protein